LLLPIAGFNPMANDFAKAKLEYLINIAAEEIAQDELEKINRKYKLDNNLDIKVGLNLVDDVGGMWSNHFVTDYKSKFEFDSILKRSFCTPHFWTSENVTKEIIVRRVKEYVFRSMFCISNSNSESLGALFAQELFVQQQMDDRCSDFKPEDYVEIRDVYQKNKNSTDYNLIFNFFYGDSASEGLGYPQFGVKGKDGFEYTIL